GRLRQPRARADAARARPRRRAAADGVSRRARRRPPPLRRAEQPAAASPPPSEDARRRPRTALLRARARLTLRRVRGAGQVSYWPPGCHAGRTRVRASAGPLIRTP